MTRVVALTVAILCTLASAGALYADQSNTGCGFGSLMFEGKDGLLSQVCAATFNSSFGSQTFGITSGTVNCAKPANFSSIEKLNRFVGDNMDNLAMDISKGNGEYLTTLAVLLEIPVEERAQFYGLMQSSFSKIYTSEAVTHVDVLNNIESVLSTS